MTLFLGIDIGTYESKGVLVDATGTVIATAACPHELIVPRPGWAEHRADEDWWGDLKRLTRSLLADSGADPARIAAVACSAIGPCMLPVDADGAPLMNAVLYGVDTRASAEVAELSDRIGPDIILDRCGNTLTSQSVGPKILWLKRNHPDLYDRTAHVLTSTSFLVQKLTGEVVMDRYSAANFGPLFDAGAQRWTDDLAADIVALDRLPRLLWTTEIAGHVTKAAAAETGLAAGTPVTAGTIDAAAEAVSVGATRTGDMMLMYGSTIFVITQTAERLRDPALWYAPGLHPGGHAGMAGLATSGTLTHWFRDRFARELPRDTAFATLAAEAATSPPGANGLLLLPYFSGERTPIHDPHARGTFFGLNLTHSRGDLYRALVEGIAYGTRHVTDSFDAAGQRPARVLAVGGGVKNPLWLQATSDITGLDQSVCGNTLGAAYGDAFLAALSVGAVQPGDIADWNPVERQITASPNAIYDTRYSQFRRLYSQTRDIMAELGKVDP